jgi:hypothetical protein
MSLSVPSYPNPYSTTPLPAAYAWIETVSLDYANGSGSLVVRVNADAASYALPPIDRVFITMGQGGFPDFTTVMQATASLDQAQTRDYLYQQLQALPQFANSQLVP